MWTRVGLRGGMLLVALTFAGLDAGLLWQRRPEVVAGAAVAALASVRSALDWPARTVTRALGSPSPDVPVAGPDAAALRSDDRAARALAELTVREVRFRIRTLSYSARLAPLLALTDVDAGIAALEPGDVTLSVLSASMDAYCLSAVSASGSGAVFYATPTTGVSRRTCSARAL